MNDSSFKLKASKTDRSGHAPIFLEFNYEGHTLIYASGEKCVPLDWYLAKQKFKRSMAGYEQANEFLERVRDKLRTGYRAARNSDIQITNDYLRELLAFKSIENQGPERVPVFKTYLEILN